MTYIYIARLGIPSARDFLSNSKLPFEQIFSPRLSALPIYPRQTNLASIEGWNTVECTIEAGGAEGGGFKGKSILERSMRHWSIVGRSRLPTQVIAISRA